MKEQLFLAAVLSFSGGAANVADFEIDQSSNILRIEDRPDNVYGITNIQAEKNPGFDISQLDPSEYPTSGKVFVALVSSIILFSAFRIWREGEKLMSDDDLVLGSRAVAASLGAAALYVLAETAADLPL